VGQTDGMQSHPEWLQKSAFFARQLIGEWKTAASGHADVFHKGTVIGPQTAEVKPPAKIRVTFLAEFAAVAGSRGVYGHAPAGLQRIIVTVSLPGASFDDGPGKFMTEH